MLAGQSRAERKRLCAAKPGSAAQRAVCLAVTVDSVMVHGRREEAPMYLAQSGGEVGFGAARIDHAEAVMIREIVREVDDEHPLATVQGLVVDAILGIAVRRAEEALVPPGRSSSRVKSVQQSRCTQGERVSIRDRDRPRPPR
jgi:hypothetical protein